jgi:hypothetical protein
MSPVYTLLWPAMGGLFLLSAIACLVGKKRVSAFGLFIPGALLLGSWWYDRSHEELVKLNCALTDMTLVKENQEHPGESIYHVSATALELGNYEGRIRAADVHSTGAMPKPGSIVAVEIGKRPFTGSYIKSIASMDYGKPQPKYTYIPPPKGEEFQYIFHQPPPANVVLEQIISEATRESGKIALAFRTDHATFERIRPPAFARVPNESFSFNRSALGEVKWWRSPTNTTEIWGYNATDGVDYKHGPKDHFNNDRAAMTWDEDGLVQYFWLGRGLLDR